MINEKIGGGVTSGTATINTTYLSGSVGWWKIGNVCTIDGELTVTTTIPSGTYGLVSGLPSPISGRDNAPFRFCWGNDYTNPSKMTQLILRNTGRADTISSIASGTKLQGSFTYLCEQ